MKGPAKIGLLFELQSRRFSEQWVGSIGDIRDQLAVGNIPVSTWTEPESKLTARILVARPTPWSTKPGPDDAGFRALLEELKSIQPGTASASAALLAYAEKHGGETWRLLQWLGWCSGNARLLDTAFEHTQRENSADINQMSGFAWACAWGNLDCVRWGLKHGVSLESTNRWGWNPTALATYNGHAGIARLLIDAGAPPTTTTESLFEQYGIPMGPGIPPPI
jgi:hypothetical protein